MFNDNFILLVFNDLQIYFNLFTILSCFLTLAEFTLYPTKRN